MKRLIVGIGNPYRRDDKIGLIIAKRLHNILKYDIVESDGDLLNLIDILQRYDLVILIDAINLQTTAGRLHKYDINNLDVEPLTSTHAINIIEVLELIKIIGKMPKMIFYGIEGKDFEMGEGLSEEVEDSIDDIVNSIVKDISYHY